MDRVDENLHRTVVWGALAVAWRRPDGGPLALAAELPVSARALSLDAAELIETHRAGTDLPAAYDGLFGHVVRGSCPAHEGEYGGPKGFRFAHEIGDVEGFYRAFGLRPARAHPERADHISVECEFFAFLALKEACALQTHGQEQALLCRDASAKFLTRHLGRFGRAFASRVRRNSREPFYRAAAALLDRTILLDAERLDVPPGPADLPLREDTGTPEDACMRCGAFEGTPR